MNQSETIKQILYDYVTAGLIERNLEKLLSLIADDVIGIGMGEQGFVSSKTRIKEIMQTMFKEETSAVYSLNIDHITINFPNESSAHICAQVLITCTADQTVTYSSMLQSLGLTLIDQTWYICFLHASPAILTKESIDAYPMVFANGSLQQLRTNMQQEMLELLNRSLSGGIISTYSVENRYPLHFINDGMLAYLGYTREEFQERFRDNVAEIVYPPDAPTILNLIDKMKSTEEDYEARFRVLKKDNTILWMLERVRFIEDEEKHKILLGVFIDVTETMELQQCLEAQAAQLEEQTVELIAQNEQLVSQKTTLEEQAYSLTISEERFRIALEKTSNVIFDYDIINGTILHSGIAQQSMKFNRNTKKRKDAVIIDRTVTAEYLDEFNRAFEAIEQGTDQTECIVKVKLSTGQEAWNKISMTGITDFEGRTVRAIGIIEDITVQKEAEIAYAREEQYRNAILSNTLATYMVNFIKDIFEDCHLNAPGCVAVNRGDPYDTIIHLVSGSHMCEEHHKLFRDTFSRANLLHDFYNEKKEHSVEYEFFYTNGTSLWMETSTRLFLDSQTREVKGFLYVTDIDHKKREELKLVHKTLVDTLTGIYNQGSVEHFIQKKLTTNDAIQSGVFMMLDIDCFKQINDTYGHPFGDQILIAVAKALSAGCRDTDIVGRLGGDEFCVFFCGLRTKRSIEEIAQKLCEKIQSIFIPTDGKIGISCSIGISMCHGSEKSFKDVYKEADEALYLVKEKCRNGYAFYGETMYRNRKKWIQNAEWILRDD